MAEKIYKKSALEGGKETAIGGGNFPHGFSVIGGDPAAAPVEAPVKQPQLQASSEAGYGQIIWRARIGAA